MPAIKFEDNRYWKECVTAHKNHNGHTIYKDERGQYIVRFRWGIDLAEDVNTFKTLKASKSFIDRVVIPEWTNHLKMESTDYVTL